MEKNELVSYRKDETFAKSNLLIQSKAKTTKLGNKIIAIGLYHIQNSEYTETDAGNLLCKIPASEIKNRLHKKGNSIYRDLSKTSASLSTYQLAYKDPERQKFRYTNLFTEISYIDGCFSIIFNGDLKKYLSELKENYTILNLPLMLKWQKNYTFRIFEMLSSKAYLYKDNGYHCSEMFSLAEFKFTIGYYDAYEEKVRPLIKGKKAPDYELAEETLMNSITPNGEAFMEWKDFYRSIILASVNEINSTPEADMYIDEVKPLKKGRGGKVYGLVINYRTHLNEQEVVTQGVDDEVAYTIESEDGIINATESPVGENVEKSMTEDEKFDFEATVKGDILLKYRLSIKDVRAICKAAKYDMQKIKQAYILLEQQHGDIENVVGWIISSIKNSYTAKKKSGNKNTFNEFDQRPADEMNINEIESALLKR